MAYCRNCKKEFDPPMNNRTQTFCSRACYREFPTPSKSPMFKTWEGMLYRCQDPRSKDFRRYGGRGIDVCQEWQDFWNFEKWAKANGYVPGRKIERINNDLGYNPGNCTFADAKQQARNRRNNRFLTAFGETKILSAWVEDPRCAVNKFTLSARITRQKLSDEVAITHPPQPKIHGGRRYPIPGSIKHG